MPENYRISKLVEYISKYEIDPDDLEKILHKPKETVSEWIEGDTEISDRDFRIIGDVLEAYDIDGCLLNSLNSLHCKKRKDLGIFWNIFDKAKNQLAI